MLKGGTFGTVGAQHFANHGANVVLIDINREALKATVASLKGVDHKKLKTCACDIRSYKDGKDQ